MTDDRWQQAAVETDPEGFAYELGWVALGETLGDDDGCEAARAMGEAIVGCEEMQAISAELRHLTERQNMRRAIVQLHDALQESMSPLRRPLCFDKQAEAALTAAAPFIDDTARQVLVGTLDNWNGNQLLIEVFADGQFHIAERENSWDTWNRGQWGWLS